MTRTEMAPAGPADGAGERAERDRRRRKRLLLGTLFLAGFVPGLYIGATRMDSVLAGEGDWPAWLSIGLTLMWLAALAAGTLMARRMTDEFERMRHYRASAFAGSVYITVYPVWYLLWMGGFAGEPMHGALFLLFWAALVAALLYYRYR